MINKLDPAREGVIFGKMTPDEQALLKDAAVENKVLVYQGQPTNVWAPVGSPQWSKCTAYWTYWERLPAPPSDKYEVRDFRKVPESERPVLPAGAVVWREGWGPSMRAKQRAEPCIYAFPKKEELPDPPSPEHEVFDFRNVEDRLQNVPKGAMIWDCRNWYPSSRVGDRAVRAVYAFPRKKGATPASLPPAAKEGWNHSELCLVHYPGNPEEQVCEGWSVAYYHWEPPFSGKPLWVDHLSDRKNPDFWWALPDVPKA